MSRQLVVSIAFLACFAAGSASAEKIEAGLEYLLKVSAPAMKSSCEPVVPGYGAKVDELMPGWLERNARQIEKSKEAMRQPGESDESLDASILQMLEAAFAEDDDAGRKAGCSEILENLAATDTNPVD
jgi:hypothetical protein